MPLALALPLALTFTACSGGRSPDPAPPIPISITLDKSTISPGETVQLTVAHDGPEGYAFRASIDPAPEAGGKCNSDSAFSHHALDNIYYADGTFGFKPRAYGQHKITVESVTGSQATATINVINAAEHVQRILMVFPMDVQAEFPDGTVINFQATGLEREAYIKFAALFARQLNEWFDGTNIRFEVDPYFVEKTLNASDLSTQDGDSRYAAHFLASAANLGFDNSELRQKYLSMMTFSNLGKDHILNHTAGYTSSYANEFSGVFIFDDGFSIYTKRYGYTYEDVFSDFLRLPIEEFRYEKFKDPDLESVHTN